MTDNTFAASRLRRQPDLLTQLVVGAGTRLLTWQPSGSLMIEMPSGRRVKFGQEGLYDAVLSLKNYRVITKSLRRGTLGFADAYIAGDVECSDLVSLFRFFVRNYHALQSSGRGLFRHSIADRLRHLLRQNTRRGSRRNITEHYDLGNAFFHKWLDEELVYSSALFGDNATTLEDAQEAKLRTILQFLAIEPGMSLLDIGSGWGALALRASRDHGARVTGITLSHEQRAFAQERAEAQGLSDCCFKLQDYRDTKGRFDRLVSVEMIEAVGEERWPLYFRTIHDRLKPGGMAIVQAITIAEDHYSAYRRKTDFIQRYIFPGGMLPTKSIVSKLATDAGLRFEQLAEFGSSYARTLNAWRLRFEARWPEIAALGFDEGFRRKWRYYLAYCEAGFLDEVIDVGLYRLRRPAASTITT
jgi:cyclopropane-fatty-acyl-phospholipid synthase